jgi:hypothetical protein
VQVLLFYGEPEADKWLPGDRYARRLFRPLYAKLSGRQATSGFRVWFEALVKALERAGHEVIVNDEERARREPDYPIGLCGYSVVLEQNRLPNPAVLGPGLYDHPKLALHLMDDPRYRAYLVTCEWMKELFGRYYGPERLHLWHGAIDTDEWPDTRAHEKNIDVLVYDKIRWNRSRLVPQLLSPLMDALRKRRLRVEVVRYGHYQHHTYRALLERSKGMLFLVESETQGMAYQEALAGNVPVLAWDPGFWLDPKRLQYEVDPVPASSVPYFSDACGVRFTGVEDFEPKLERFLNGRFEPRAFVQRELSFESSAEKYLRVYRALMPSRRAA